LDELQIAEEHLRKLNNDLEKRVMERTNALMTSENTLKAKNKELEKINVDLDNFIYTASHDLKSPIVNLEGLVNHLRKKLYGIDSFEDFKLLDMVKISIEKLKRTIADLTEITKVQKDLGEDAEQISFKEILEDVKDGINTNIIESKAIIKEDFDVLHIVYPKRNLRSIIYNLLSNAIKYRALERALEIDIKTYKENGSIVLSVQDNGMGVSKNQQHKLFAMFKRLHTHVEGTGIGLYIIKRVIENRGGWIEVESTLNEGTVFKVHFKNSPEEISTPVTST
jgi:signal transduction histidine kinase